MVEEVIEGETKLKEGYESKGLAMPEVFVKRGLYFRGLRAENGG